MGHFDCCYPGEQVGYCLTWRRTGEEHTPGRLHIGTKGFPDSREGEGKGTLCYLEQVYFAGDFLATEKEPERDHRTPSFSLPSSAPANCLSTPSCTLTHYLPNDSWKYVLHMSDEKKGSTEGLRNLPNDTQL